MTDEPKADGPEQLDMSMNAKADVQWANPDALTREQLIRTNAFSLALQVERSGFLDEYLTSAGIIAKFITDGTS